MKQIYFLPFLLILYTFPVLISTSTQVLWILVAVDVTSRLITLRKIVMMNYQTCYIGAGTPIVKAYVDCFSKKSK